jgi:subtilase family serine protease
LTATSTGLVDRGTYSTGGGGHSIFWPVPNYQKGPEVISAYTVRGSSNCASTGQPDISATANPLTGYAEYCILSSYVSRNPTGTDHESACLGLAPVLGAPGWFHIGGASLSVPLFVALFADRDAFHGRRAGNANYLLYSLFDNPRTYAADFHDITGPRSRTTTGSTR